MATVLVVTSRPGALETLADELARAGYFAFVATPAGVDALYPTIVFDLIMLLSDVPDLERAAIAKLPFIRNRRDDGKLVLTNINDHNLIAVLRERVDPMKLIDE